MLGNKILDSLIIALNLVAGFAAAGLFVYTNMVYKAPVFLEHEEVMKLKASYNEAARQEIYVMDRIIVNLLNPTARLRYLEIIPGLEPYNADDLQLLKDFNFKIVDSFIRVSTAMAPEELNSVSGKILFENRLRQEIDRVFEKKIVKKIYFSKFTIQ